MIKKKSLLISIIIIAVVFLFLIIKQFEKDKQNFQHSFKNINVELVQKAKSFSDLFEVVEQISFNGKLIGSIIKVKKLPNANYGVIDAATKHVNIFDSSGNYVRTIGGTGEGPGEYYNAMDFLYDDTLNIYILDPTLYRILCFNEKGDYKWTIKIKNNAEHMILAENKIYLYSTMSMFNQPNGYCYNLKDGEKEFEFAEPTDFLKLLISNRNISLFINSSSIDYFDKKIYLIHPYQYAVREFDTEGKEIRLLYLSSEDFSPFDSLRKFNPSNVLPGEFIKSAFNGLKLWNGLIFTSFLNNENNKHYLDIYDLNGSKLNDNSFELPESFPRNTFFPLSIDSRGNFYSYFQPLPDSAGNLSNPLLLKYRFLASK